MRTLIAIPCMDMVHTIFLRAILGLNQVGECQYAISCSSLIYDARNNLAKQAIKEGYDYMMWFDSDMDFQPDFMPLRAAVNTISIPPGEYDRKVETQRN